MSGCSGRDFELAKHLARAAANFRYSHHSRKEILNASEDGRPLALPVESDGGIGLRLAHVEAVIIRLVERGQAVCSQSRRGPGQSAGAADDNPDGYAKAIVVGNAPRRLAPADARIDVLQPVLAGAEFVDE